MEPIAETEGVARFCPARQPRIVAGEGAPSDDYLPRVLFAVLYASVTLVLPIKDLKKPFCVAVEKPLVDVLRVFRPMQGNEPLRWYAALSQPAQRQTAALMD